MATLSLEKTAQPTFQEDTAELERLLEHSYGRARDYFEEVHARHGDVPELAYWKRIMVPRPAVLTRGGTPPRDPDSDIAWIRAHAKDYWGEWLAIYDGRLIAHGQEAAAVVTEGRAKSPDPDFTLFFAGEYPR